MQEKKKKTPLALKVALIVAAVAIAAGAGVFLYWDRKPPEVKAQNHEVEYGAELLVKELATAKDDRTENVPLKIDSVFPEGAVIAEDGSSVTFPKVGEYKVTVLATDDFDNTQTAEATVKVIDRTPPEFMKVANEYTVVYGKEIPIVNTEDAKGAPLPSAEGTTEAETKETDKTEEIQETIDVLVKDASSDVVTLSVSAVKGLDKQGKDSFAIDGDKVTFSRTGAYEMELKAEDADGNSDVRSFRVKVLDKTPPVFQPTEDSYEVAYGKEIKAVRKKDTDKTENTLYVDAEDEISKVKLKISEIKPKGKLKEDSFKLEKGTATFRKTGTYEATITATDEAGNKAKVQVEVKAVDKTKPEFKGLPKSISLTDKDKDYDWMKKVTAEDEIDGDLTKDVEVKAKAVKFGTPGNYLVAYSVKDKAGNKEEKTIDVVISDTTPPVLTVPDSFTFNVGDPEPDYAKGAKAKDKGDGEVKVKVDASKVDPKKPGNYTVTYSAKDKSGNKASKDVKVTVKAKLQD